MGAQNSIVDYPIVGELDKISYSPGEIVTGAFHFDFSRDPSRRSRLKVKKNAAFILTLVQMQQTSIKGIISKNDTEISSQTLSSPQIEELNKNPDTKIPFQFQLPSNILPSFEYPKNQSNYCFIRNIIRVQMKEIYAEGNIFLMIRKLSSPLNSPLDIVEKTHKKGLLTGGDILLRATYNTNSFPLLSKIPLTFQVDFSQCTYKIKNINFVLKRRIKIYEKISGKFNEYIDDLQELNIKGNFSKTLTVQPFIELSEGKEIYGKYDTKILSLVKGLQPNQLISLMPSVKTNLFECVYFIKAKAVHEIPLLESPSMDIPIDTFQIDNSGINLTINPYANGQPMTGYGLQQPYGGQIPPQQFEGQAPFQQSYQSQFLPPQNPGQQTYGNQINPSQYQQNGSQIPIQQQYVGQTPNQVVMQQPYANQYPPQPQYGVQDLPQQDEIQAKYGPPQQVPGNTPTPNSNPYPQI